ncbi:aminotransferase class V-fold PLP-dependent enzyme [Phytohabitans aurantiacus]|uniref:aminotransferase class V-fold PLP-dependent enzyme n=1 Tax=Phytohabitans aurantiacus TaxID=3016789 RepID=UPI0024938AA2|nr:aminotransferase class V-fold PLP-dependent enzyme [Phytohabitans aurantiacus]
MRRRSVLGAAAALGLVGCTDPEPAASSTPPLIPTDWTSVRAQFAIDRKVAHLTTFALAPAPAPVRAAIEKHRAGLDADPIGYLHEHEQERDAAVAAGASGYLGAPAEQIAFTHSTTAGLGLLYSGLRLARGDEVLTTEHDFYSTHETLRLRSERDGVTVRRVRLYADPVAASVDEIVGNLARAVTPRTKVVAVTWVHSSTGVKLPVRAIADALRGRGVLLCVDGVHGFAAEDADLGALGCDFLVSGCHKWLLGPRGTGLIAGTPAGWQGYQPIVPPFQAESFAAWFGQPGAAPPPGPAATPGGYHAFEHRWALAEAFDFHKAIGKSRVAARNRELATALKDGLAGVSKVRLVTPKSPELSAGIVCCEVSGVAPGTAVERLRESTVIASVTPYQHSVLRFGATIANDESDVEAALKAVRTL